MAEPLAADTTPLVVGADRVIRVSGTRVTFDTLVASFQDGATPEEIVHQYPSVPLADVYQVIAYYLHHTADMESYLTRRRQEMDEARRSSERNWAADGIRARLLARRQR